MKEEHSKIKVLAWIKDHGEICSGLQFVKKKKKKKKKVNIIVWIISWE